MTDQSAPLAEAETTALDRDLMLQSAAERIRLRLRRTAEDIVLIGQDLIEAKRHLEHGEFLPWIAAQFELSESTALNFMRVAEVYGGKTATVADLAPAALYELAAPSTPQEIRDQVEAKASEGEKVTAAEVKDLKARLRAARKETAEAEKYADYCKTSYVGVEQERNALAQRVAELEAAAPEALPAAEHPLYKPAMDLARQMPPDTLRAFSTAISGLAERAGRDCSPEEYLAASQGG